MLKILEPYKTALALILSLALLGGVFYWGYSTSSDKWSAKWVNRDKADLAAAKKFTDEQRRIELQRIHDAEQLQKDAEDEKRRLAAAAAAADSSRRRLQQSIEGAIAILRGGGNPTLNTSSPDASKVGSLLADLYREINEQYGAMAVEADGYYTAGLTCNKQWDKLRGTNAAAK